MFFPVNNFSAKSTILSPYNTNNVDAIIIIVFRDNNDFANCFNAPMLPSFLPTESTCSDSNLKLSISIGKLLDNDMNPILDDMAKFGSSLITCVNWNVEPYALFICLPITPVACEVILYAFCN